MRLPAHEATTAQLGAAYPFVASQGLPVDRVLVGRDLLGGVFAYDPFELYAAGVLTNPNMVVFGQIGRGKSALMKSYLLRQAVFGRRILVLDPKGEYGPLATFLGVAPVALRPGGSLRLNPLDGPSRDRNGQDTQRVALLVALARACLGRALSPIEHAGLELGLGAATRDRSRHFAGPPTLGEVVEVLLAPTEGPAAALGTDAAGLKRATRDLALGLRRLVHGELRGMFDGPTSPGVDLAAQVVVLDLSAVYHSPALAALVACAAAAVSGAPRPAGTRTILVLDEAWAVLADPGVAAWLQSTWKLSRALGIANVAVMHRVSDLTAAGSAGSQAERLAEGLLADSETLVCYGQAPGEVDVAQRLLGLSSAEAELLPRLRRGVALWRVGGRPFLVEHRLGRLERPLVDTDASLRGAGQLGA